MRRAVAREQDSQEPSLPETVTDAVQVMTIHGAKGLDFKHVYLMQLHKGLHSGGSSVVNIAWQRSFSQYGNYGNHTDGTRAPFVQAYIADHIIKPVRTARARLCETLARNVEEALPGVSLD